MTKSNSGFSKLDYYEQVVRGGTWGGLTDAQLRVWLACVSYADSRTGGRIYPGNERLALDVAANEKTVRRALVELCARGLIRMVGEKGRSGRATEYALICDAEGRIPIQEFDGHPSVHLAADEQVDIPDGQVDISELLGGHSDESRWTFGDSQVDIPGPLAGQPDVHPSGYSHSVSESGQPTYGHLLPDQVHPNLRHERNQGDSGEDEPTTNPVQLHDHTSAEEVVCLVVDNNDVPESLSYAIEKMLRKDVPQYCIDEAVREWRNDWRKCNMPDALYLMTYRTICEREPAMAGAHSWLGEICPF